MASTKNGVHVKEGEGTAIWFLGELYEIKIDGEKLGGPTVMQITVPPGPMLGAPPHIHDCDEVAHVLEGTLRFHVGERVEEARAGSVFFFPKGTTEWFENASNQQAKVLITYSNGHMASFFKEVGEPARERRLPPPPAGPPDLEKLGAIARKHGLEVMAPPS